MGNAQSQSAESGQSNPTSPLGPLPGKDAKDAKGGNHNHHFPHPHHNRKPPQRKNSLSTATPLKAAPSISTAQDHDLLLNADRREARGTTTPSHITATEKLLDLSNSTATSTESSPPQRIVVPSKQPAQDDEKSSKIDSIISVEAPAPSRRRNSFGSATTVDTVDLDEMNIDDTKAIPTTIEWPEEGKKVYVTGTFSGWKKKFKLTRSDGHLSTVVPLPAGTHHMKFLVDGQMKISDGYPTAVDAAGVLVNYIEVLADDMPPLERQLSTHSAEKPPDLPPAMIESESFLRQTAKPTKRYTSVIPAYLEDLEEKQEQYGRNFDAQLPPPPSLPMILSKVILNGTSTLRDDSSVLPIPNHVVLNHLATSSIKNQVLAISATSRYKKKYVTTVLFKSTNASE